MIGRRSIALAAFGLACALAAGCGSGSSEPPSGGTASAAPASTPAAATPPAPRDSQPQPADALPPLPITPFPAARPPEIVRAVYTFAAQHPEVLSHIPCFCGCERRGHANNDDCFVTSRDARGRVTGWEPHGVG
jgi:Protein of unknown function with PCYCGC motif